MQILLVVCEINAFQSEMQCRLCESLLQSTMLSAGGDRQFSAAVTALRGSCCALRSSFLFCWKLSCLQTCPQWGSLRQLFILTVTTLRTQVDLLPKKSICSFSCDYNLILQWVRNPKCFPWHLGCRVGAVGVISSMSLDDLLIPYSTQSIAREPLTT